MAKLNLNRVSQAVLAALSLGLIAVLLVAWLQRTKIQNLIMAAGASSGESYLLGNALKKVVELHYPRVRINLLETGGTVENLQMLEDGRAQLAAAQADILPGPRARAVAVLYDDTFQLLIPRDSQVQSLVDLRGQRIALARSGGQFQSFLRVVGHFGLHQRRESKQSSDPISLTDRQRAVLAYVSEGWSNQQIGQKLECTEAAVKAVMQELFRKFEVRKRAQIVRIAMQNQLMRDLAVETGETNNRPALASALRDQELIQVGDFIIWDRHRHG